MKIVCYFAMLVMLAAMTMSHAGDIDPAAMQEANLRAVTFIDADRGWAVGERGTIVHSVDGGTTWDSQPSPTKATLCDVAMYNSQRGLAIGGSYNAHTQLSAGEVMITKDGGESWFAATNHHLPRLRKLLIGPGGKCVAIGDWCPAQTTAVFTSDNGGQSWQPRASDIVGSLVGIAGSADDFLVLSDRGEVLRFQSDAKPQPIFPAEANWHTLVGHRNDRLLIGTRGAIRSRDNGLTWQSLAPSADAHATFAAGQPLAAMMADSEIWLAQDSSSSITTIHDEASQAVPHRGGASLRGLMRLDEDRGWAVGDFGLIMATRDGGQSWRVLRGGNRLPAVMFIAARGEALPWSLIAQESFQHQRRVALVIDSEHNRHSARGLDLLSDVSGILGPATTHLACNDAQRVKDLLTLLRPAVIVLDPSLSAMQRDVWTSLALSAGAKRVLEVSAQGTQTVHVAAAIPAVGILASDVWHSAIAQLAPGSLLPNKLMLRPLFDATRDTSAGDGLAACTRLDRRYGWTRTTSATRRQLQILQARTAELTWVESLVVKAKTSDEFYQLLGPSLLRMSDPDRQRMLANLFSMTASQSRQDLYVATLERSVERPDKSVGGVLDNPPTDQSDLLQLAQLRLDSLRVSTEWRQTFGESITSTPAGTPAGMLGFDEKTASIDLAVQWSPFQSPQASPAQPAVQQASHAMPIEPFRQPSPVQLASGGSTSSATVQSSKQHAAVDLRWEFHPAVLLARRAAQQHPSLIPPTAVSGATSQSPSTQYVTKPGEPASAASTNLRRLLDRAAAGRWGVLAADRLGPDWIACGVATTQPYLDGTFDEPWWSDGQTFDIGPDRAVIRMAHDNEFVYLAIDAARLEPSPHNKEIRKRDTSLDLADRYRVRIDLDRDLMTAFEFEFDSNGNTRDSCDGFVQFQPQWYIACTQLADRNRVEIAIQKADLGADKAVEGAIWNLSLDRLRQHSASRGLAMPDPESWRPCFLQ